MEIRLYGYPSQEDSRLTELREVTVCVDAAGARRIAEFFATCSEKLALDPDWEHEHFDAIEFPSIVVFNSSKAG